MPAENLSSDDTRTSNNTSASDGTPSALDSVLRTIIEVLGGAGGTVSLFRESEASGAITSSYGLSTGALASLQPIIDKAKSELNEEVQSGQVVKAKDGAFAKNEQVGEVNGSKIILLPFSSEDKIVGILCLVRPSSSPQFLASLQSADTKEGSQVDIVRQNVLLFQRLVEEKQWLETIIQYNADGIAVIDNKFRIIGFNSTIASMTGWKASDVWGKACCDVLQFRTRSGIDWCQHSCPLRVSSDNRAARIPPIELLMTTRDGREVDIEASYAIIRSPSGDTLGGIIDIRDIRARREAEELQSTFLSVISHELQTPIAIIEGYASLMSEGELSLTEEEKREKLGIIKEESARLSKLVDRLLYASRIQAGAITLNIEPLDLKGLIRRIAKKMSAVSRKHSVELDLPAEIPSVLADYEQIEEVMRNLIENAIKYTPGGGRITIDAEIQADAVIVGIDDEGQGIPEDQRERVFERFSRLDSRLIHQVRGTGLGLFICKAIIETHGGKISVEPSKAGGARFRFSLPREQQRTLPARIIDLNPLP